MASARSGDTKKSSDQLWAVIHMQEHCEKKSTHTHTITEKTRGLSHHELSREMLRWRRFQRMKNNIPIQRIPWYYAPVIKHLGAERLALIHGRVVLAKKQNETKTAKKNGEEAGIQPR